VNPIVHDAFCGLTKTRPTYIAKGIGESGCVPEQSAITPRQLGYP
jgi:hypothetical protein